MFHDKSKHIEIKYHYIRDMVQRGVVKLQYVATNDQIVDVLTKPLARVKNLATLTNTRPDIFFAMNTLIQFLTDLRHVHLITAKHILRYLRGTIEYEIKY